MFLFSLFIANWGYYDLKSCYQFDFKMKSNPLPLKKENKNIELYNIYITLYITLDILLFEA